MCLYYIIITLSRLEHRREAERESVKLSEDKINSTQLSKESNAGAKRKENELSGKGKCRHGEDLKVTE